MRLPANASLRAGLFALLAVGSIGLKAAVGPTRDSVAGNDSEAFMREAASILQSQKFAVARRPMINRSDLILATRGNCRIAVRDAKWGSAVTDIYAQDARSVGPVRYLYRGGRYSSPPGLRVRWQRLKHEALERLGLSAPMPILVAFAASSSCGGSDFGLGDVRLAT